MEQYLEDLFSIADHNEHGALNEGEFRKLMSMSGFNFNDETLKRLLLASDENDDGMIDVGELKKMVAEMRQREEMLELHWLKNNPKWTQNNDTFRSQAAADEGFRGPATNILHDNDGIWICAEAGVENWVRFDLGCEHELTKFELVGAFLPEIPKACELQALVHDAWVTVTKWTLEEGADGGHSTLEFDQTRAQEWKLLVYSSYGDANKGGCAVRHVNFYGRRYLPLEAREEEAMEEANERPEEKEAASLGLTLTPQDADAEDTKHVEQNGEAGCSEVDTADQAVKDDDGEEETVETAAEGTWSSMTTCLRGMKLGIIKKKSSKGWVQPTAEWLVAEKAKQFAASMPTCVAFAIHPTEGVEFYSEDAFNPKKGYRESVHPGWTAQTWVSAVHYSPFYEKEAVEQAKLKKLRESLPETLEPEDLDQYLLELFEVCDENRDGVLEAWEFKKLLSISGFKLSETTVAEMLAEFDSNGDGVIALQELQVSI